jgi:alpha-galactosidase
MRFEPDADIKCSDWGVDYLKYDDYAGVESLLNPLQVGFGAMRDALKRTGRNILFSLFEWGSKFP